MLENIFASGGVPEVLARASFLENTYIFRAIFVLFRRVYIVLYSTYIQYHNIIQGSLPAAVGRDVY